MVRIYTMYGTHDILRRTYCPAPIARRDLGSPHKTDPTVGARAESLKVRLQFLHLHSITSKRSMSYPAKPLLEKKTAGGDGILRCLVGPLL